MEIANQKITYSIKNLTLNANVSVHLNRWIEDHIFVQACLSTQFRQSCAKLDFLGLHNIWTIEHCIIGETILITSFPKFRCFL